MFGTPGGSPYKPFTTPRIREGFRKGEVIEEPTTAEEFTVVADEKFGVSRASSSSHQVRRA